MKTKKCWCVDVIYGTDNDGRGPCNWYVLNLQFPDLPNETPQSIVKSMAYLEAQKVLKPTSKDLCFTYVVTIVWDDPAKFHALGFKQADIANANVNKIVVVRTSDPE